ncbi:FYVE zinc finger-domain-containing protein [Ampelomyces quisqualis]|uniref:RING-type E3 ubiquitin transferase n=1 Tax=Ampelomyces quisqualis TaxID=50730 RepID=A0A6A5QLZ7_AMPQU|nr:FYVE zinc finger-domain-containing protein [Ampelomyces quisqualis]
MAPNNTTQHAGPYPTRHSSMLNQRSHETTGAGEGVGEGASHSHGAVASHYLAQQPPNAPGGETWMDFLADPSTRSRTATNSPPQPPPHSSSSRYTLPTRPSPGTESSLRSTDRKRRLTTADSPMRRPSSIRMHSSNQGASVTDPIIIDSPPATTMRELPPPPLSPQTPAEPPRRGSEIALPPWQPDADVSQCPVCDKKFTFLYRKHHCRKCGRVVCASCSPHRITIPRQFIVHPPSDATSNIIDLTSNEENNMSPFRPFRNPALGGGEEVRVCNPCVPDPNYGPPPLYNPSATSRHPSQSSASSRPYYPPGLPQHPRAHRSTSNAQDSSRNAGHGQTQRTHESGSDRRRVSYHSGFVSGERQLPPLPGHAQTSHVRPSINNSSISRYTTPNSGHIPFNLPSSQLPRSAFTAVPPPTMPQPTRPRRQVAEEDECPICGHELPAKGPGGDEADRIQHIEDCIALHSGSPAPAPLTHTTSASLPAQRTRGMSNAGEGASNRMSHAARGMFPFTATEKDCLDADGGPEECVICMEDYEAGEKLARLPCWCKFHEECIKKWWGKKGRGACPTHQLHE